MKDSKYLVESFECTNCNGREKVLLEEDITAPGDKVYPTGSILCAKCRTPTMVKVYRWTKWKESNEGPS